MPRGIAHAAAAGAAGETNRAGVRDGGIDVLSPQPQGLGDDHGHGGAAAANVNRAFGEVDRAIVVDGNGSRRHAAAVEPKTTSHAAPPIRTFELAVVVLRILGSLHGFLAADLPVHRAVGAARPLFSGVL